MCNEFTTEDLIKEAFREVTEIEMVGSFHSNVGWENTKRNNGSWNEWTKKKIKKEMTADC